jgi:hypothetical protein
MALALTRQETVFFSDFDFALFFQMYEYLKHLINITDVSSDLILFSLEFYSIHNSFPSKEALTTHVFERRRCGTEKLFAHYISLGICPSCSDVRIINQFASDRGRFPSPQELIEFRQASSRDGREGLIDLSKLNVSLASEEAYCTICQDSINFSQKQLQLMPCKHCFHFEQDQCLGYSSVFIWLEQSLTCPCCRESLFS